MRTDRWLVEAAGDADDTDGVPDCPVEDKFHVRSPSSCLDMHDEHPKEGNQMCLFMLDLAELPCAWLSQELMRSRTSDALEPGKPALEHLFTLDPSWHHLNHGSYGANLRYTCLPAAKFSMLN